MKYILTNTYGTPFNAFYDGDMELSEIFSFKRSCHEVYSSRKEASERLVTLAKRAEAQRSRWGDTLTAQVLNVIRVMFIRKYDKTTTR